MRSTADLIQELDGEAQKFDKICIVVGFENTTTFVFDRDEGRQSALDAAVEVGGEPVGLIGLKFNNGSATFHARPLQEYDGDPAMQEYLKALVSEVAQRLKIASWSRKGWVN